MTKRFRYALAPVLLTREWRRDDLMRQVTAAERAATNAQAALVAARADTDAAMAAWSASCLPGQTLTPALLQRHAYHAATRRAMQEQLEREWYRLDQAYRALQGQLRQALHGVDALERHRDTAGRDYFQAALKAEYRASDEQWIASFGEESV